MAVIERAIIDTGPLVSYLDPHDEHNCWALEQVEYLEPPLLTCESVLSEAIFLLKRLPGGQKAVLRLVEIGALAIKFNLSENASAVKALLQKYKDSGISLADACIVRMSELNADHAVFTLDSDFQIYRKHGRQPIKLISPTKG